MYKSVFTCDVCGVEVTNDGKAMPDGWEIVTLEKAGPVKAQLGQFHVCSTTCVGRIGPISSEMIVAPAALATANAELIALKGRLADAEKRGRVAEIEHIQPAQEESS